jgi:anti-anti-sigma factor
VEVPGRFLTISANGIDFEVLTAGTGDHLALCLHGFPEHAISWRRQIPLLVELGYRVWAPNQRGYGKTTRPDDVAAYAPEHLLADVAALIDASGARRVTLIGHDWGAAVAWLFAIRRLRPLESLVIMNVPHPALFTRALQRSLRQRLKSWYIAFFQLPELPERLLGANRAYAIGRAFASATEKANFPRELIDFYRDRASEPGAIRAMLAWYRAAARGGMLAQLKLGFPKIAIPTLMIWGEADVALGKETTYGTERYVDRLRLQYLPGVSHWVQQDAPERVNAVLRSFLGEEAAREVEVEDARSALVVQPPAIRVERHGDVSVVVTSGELDLSVSELLAERIAAIGDERAVVSLADCTYLDSTILTVLVKSTAAREGRLAVILPVTHKLRRIFEIANVNHILNVVGTLDEAIAFG